MRTAFGYEGCPVVLVPKPRPKTIESKVRFKTHKPGKPTGRADAFRQKRHDRYSRKPAGNRTKGWR